MMIITLAVTSLLAATCTAVQAQAIKESDLPTAGTIAAWHAPTTRIAPIAGSLTRPRHPTWHSTTKIRR